MLGLCCCTQAFSSCGEQGLLFIAVHGLFIAVASLVEHSLWACGLQYLWYTGSVVVAHGLSCSAARGIFPDQGSSPCPLHWQEDSQPLRHQGSPSSFLKQHLLCHPSKLIHVYVMFIPWWILSPCGKLFSFKTQLKYCLYMKFSLISKDRPGLSLPGGPTVLTIFFNYSVAIFYWCLYICLSQLVYDFKDIEIISSTLPVPGIVPGSY